MIFVEYLTPSRPGLAVSAAAALLLVAVSSAQADSPTSPGNLRYEVYSNTAAEVFWDRASDDDLVIGYDVLVSGESVSVDGEPLDRLSFYSELFEQGVRYTVDVLSIDSEGNRSEPVSFSIVGGDRTPMFSDAVDPDTTIGPDSPTNVRADVYSTRSIEVFWDRVTDTVLRYEVLLDGAPFDTTDGTSSYLGTLVPGTLYAVSVIATDADGNRSAPSSTMVMTRERGDDFLAVEPPGDGLLLAPANASIEVYSGTAAELFWDRVPRGQRVQVSRDGVLLDERNATSYYDDARERDVLYRYELVAIDAAGDRSAIAVVDETIDTDVPVDVDALDGLDVPGGLDAPDGLDVPDGLDTERSVFQPLASDIVDPDSFYDEDGYADIDVLRVDLRTVTTAGICTIDDQSGCTLADVIADVDGDDDFKVEIPVHFTTGDFADDGSSSNATLRQRGNTARLGEQKSFRIKLDSKDDLWRNERRLQLNKHPFERTRLRNKLAFDLMRGVPHLPSLRTQFVNLWIDDSAGAVDYGLFTHVEFAGKEYLVNRARDKDDNVYKVEFFDFAQDALNELAVDDEGEPLDKDLFEGRLKIERGDDHSKLVEMLSALHDPAHTFESVLEQYFNRNNVLSWVTTNLLLRQADSIATNYYLYNPAGTDTFYFLPWDYDGALQPEAVLINSVETAELQKRLFFGYARGANNEFLNRLYRMPGFHATVLAAADELRESALSNAEIDARSLRYREVIEPFLTRSPDVDVQPYDASVPLALSGFVAGNRARLDDGFDVPMPPELLEPEVLGGNVVFRWTQAFDVTGRNILSYELQIADHPDFAADAVQLEATGIPDVANAITGEIEYVVDSDGLPNGTLYARLIARGDTDPDRAWQVARNRLRIDDEMRFGIIAFEAR